MTTLSLKNYVEKLEKDLATCFARANKALDEHDMVGHQAYAMLYHHIADELEHIDGIKRRPAA